MSIDIPENASVHEVFRQLSSLIYAGASAQSVHEALVVASTRLVDGCDRASLLLSERRRYRTAASTDAIARGIDRIEVELGEGPCVDAINDESYQHDPDLTDSVSPWPRFTQRILAETPVRSAIGYRLLVDDEKVGALNLFSETPGALTQASADAGAVLASFASVTLMALRAREQASTLREGLQSNREIGKAVGLIMSSHRLSSGDAFALLRRTSQQLNVKLAQVAAQVVLGQETQLSQTSGDREPAS